jgi:hypothetical protein
MQINVSITLGKDENVNDMSQDEIADAILKACGGDEDKDYVTVTVTLPEPGVAGTPPGPPEPFFVQGPGAE